MQEINCSFVSITKQINGGIILWKMKWICKLFQIDRFSRNTLRIYLRNCLTKLAITLFSLVTKRKPLGQIYQFSDVVVYAFIRFSTFSFTKFSFTTKSSHTTLIFFVAHVYFFLFSMFYREWRIFSLTNFWTALHSQLWILKVK